MAYDPNDDRLRVLLAADPQRPGRLVQIPSGAYLAVTPGGRERTVTRHAQAALAAGELAPRQRGTHVGERAVIFTTTDLGEAAIVRIEGGLT